jgi:hypothetical protein
MDFQTFQPLACATESVPAEIPDHVDFSVVLGVLNGIVALSKACSTLHRAIYYSSPEKTVAVDYDALERAGIKLPPACPSQFVPERIDLRVLHCVVGKAAETGELAELVLRAAFGEGFDKHEFKKELGDGRWYDAIGLDAVGCNDEGPILDAIIEKLRKRYGDKFDGLAAVNRDTRVEDIAAWAAMERQNHTLQTQVRSLPATDREVREVSIEELKADLA